MMTLVRDVMTGAPLTIDPEAPLATAAAVMGEREIRGSNPSRCVRPA